MGRLSAKKRQRHENAAKATPASVATLFAQQRRTWLLWALLLGGATGLSFLIFKLVLVPDVPPELIGAWQVSQGEMRGSTLEFKDDGTLTATMTRKGKKVTFHSTVKVDGKQMTQTSKDEKTGKEEIVRQTIVELTADELVIRDEDALTYFLTRRGD